MSIFFIFFYIEFDNLNRQTNQYQQFFKVLFSAYWDHFTQILMTYTIPSGNIYFSSPVYMTTYMSQLQLLGPFR